VEHHKATALSNIGLIEFIEGTFEQPDIVVLKNYGLRKTNSEFL
jgi:hypothetical protein